MKKKKKKILGSAVYIERAVDGEHQSLPSNFNPRATIHGQRAAGCAYSKKSPSVRTSRGREKYRTVILLVALWRVSNCEGAKPLFFARRHRKSPLRVNYVNKLVNWTLTETNVIIAKINGNSCSSRVRFSNDSKKHGKYIYFIFIPSHEKPFSNRSFL